MLGLQEFRNKSKGLSDLLNYAVLIEEGIVLQKDGSLLASFEFTGIDTASSTDDELEFLTSMVSRATQLLTTGFMLHVDSVRTIKKAYPNKKTGFFNDKATQIIDDERREYFGNDFCFSTNSILTITYMPQYPKINKNDTKILEKAIDFFKKNLIVFEDNLSAVLSLHRLTEYEADLRGEKLLYSELLSHLETCITGSVNTIAVPPVAMYLDAVLGNEDFTAGIEPKIGDKYISVMSIDGFPQYSFPMMFNFFNSVGIELRFSTRYICLDQYDAEQEIEKYVKGWNQQILGFTDQFMKNQNGKVNRNALAMREDAEQAKSSVQMAEVGAGYITSTIVMTHKDSEVLEEQCREIRTALQALGFSSRVETINAVEAYLGSLPGNSFANIRRPLMNTLNLADMLPLSTIYTGLPYNPSPFFPENSRPLAVLTTGSTPFWFNLHVGDLGHTLIFGPTGAGKSTLLGLIVAQFKAYENAHIYAFDKGMSLFPLCKGARGSHFEIGGDDNSLAFAPLQDIDENHAEIAWAEEWVSSLLELQGLIVLPAHSSYIYKIKIIF